MSNTTKARLQLLLTSLDSLFSTAHAADRDYLSRQRAASTAHGYGKHSNRATGAS